LNLFAKRDSVDRSIQQHARDVRQALKLQDGEFHLRLHGQSEYALVREGLFKAAQSTDKKFWHGKVSLKPKVVSKAQDKSETVLMILFRGSPIGEIRENDLPVGGVNQASKRAKELLDFSPDAKQSGRAVIHDDMMGFAVRLFIKPINAG
jgi:hypothetical protein